MKPCKKCGAEKDLSEFYKHKMMADGHLNVCKICKINYQHRHRESNLELIQEYDRLRGRTPERKEKARKRSPKYKDKRSEYNARYCEKNPEKRKAHNLVWSAIKSGRLIKQPCEVCGEIKVEAHHDDYSKPLDVRWLCRIHHGEGHRI